MQKVGTSRILERVYTVAIAHAGISFGGCSLLTIPCKHFQKKNQKLSIKAVNRWNLKHNDWTSTHSYEFPGQAQNRLNSTSKNFSIAT